MLPLREGARFVPFPRLDCLGLIEAGSRPVEPAIGNAVANALGGARVKDLPLRPERMVDLLRGERPANGGE